MEGDSASIRLKVGELTAREEFGRGIARLDTSAMKEIGIREGDAILIEGSKKSVSIAVRAYPADVGLNVIRMDGITRRNCDTSIGEYVKVKKAEVKEAKKITLAPAQKGITVHMNPEYLKQNLFKRVMTKGDIIIQKPVARKVGGMMSDDFDSIFDNFFGQSGSRRSFTPFGGEIRFFVANAKPDGPVFVDELTEIELLPEAVEVQESSISMLTYEDIGGLHDKLDKIREMIELPLRHPELFEKIGIEPPKGVLLYGPPGTGKTLIAKAVANESGAHFISVSGPEFMSKFYGESEQNLRKIFEEAEKNAPAIIFIDEIDSIAPKREEVTGEVERRVVAQLLSLMDGLKSRGKVIVIAATNRANALDPALRRPGRFDRELEIGIPDRKGRKEILQIHSRNMPIVETDMEKLSEKTYGFSGADLEALCKEAAMHALRRVLPDIKWKDEKELPREILEKLWVSKDDFDHALMVVEPSAMREVLVEVPATTWADIGGLEQAKNDLRETVEWPMKYPDVFNKMGIEPPHGILLYGPPGCGKTLMARASASESGSNFISVKGPEIVSKWVGESEKKIRDLFRRAKQVAPTIIFFDEIDSIAPRRGMHNDSGSSERVVSQILTEMSGLEKLHGVVVMAATNRPDIMDSALLRPGRFDRHVLINGPDKKAREEIFSAHTRKMPLEKDVDLKKLAEKAEGYSGADIEAVCREAAMNSLRDSKMKPGKVKAKDFDKAMTEITPSISKELMKAYGEMFDKVKPKKKAKEKLGSAGEELGYVG